jgi:hypothetical protein
MGSYIKNKYRAASKGQKAMHCSYDSNFHLMISTHAEETRTCTASWKFHVTEQNVWH